MLWPEPQEWEDSDLLAACEAIAGERDLAFLLVPTTIDYAGWVSAGGMSSSLPSGVVILLPLGPLHPATLLDWREGLSQVEPPVRFRFLRLPDGSPEAGWQPWIVESLCGFGSRPEEEDVGLLVGSLVSAPPPESTGHLRGYEPYALTIPPDGALASILSRLDAVRRSFAQMCPSPLRDARRKVHAALDTMIGEPGDGHHRQLYGAIQHSGFLATDRSRLPRVLLLGESGVGKTVAARYMATRSVERMPFERIPVPEYLEREDHFELDVFGYCRGAYTGARDDGSRGALGQLIGGVVFFDEIGDASPTIQAKLLAYLDDYVVKPRGFARRGYYCPTLVVAATNRDILRDTGEVEGPLRPDLLNRFNEVIRLPSLADRASEFDAQVDLLLQKEAFASEATRDQPIRHVGVRAMERIRGLDFRGKNFRLLERVLATACLRARAERRDYLVEADI